MADGGDGEPAPRIVDAHCHVPSTLFLPRALIESSIGNLSAAFAAARLPHDPRRLLDTYLARLQDHDADGFVADMDAAGVAQAVLLLPDFTHAIPGSGPDIEDMIRRHAAILRRHPGRFVYFCGVDPRWGPEAPDIFERAVREHGCSGLKLYPPCGYSPSERSLFPFYEICRAHRLPVLLHTGPTAPLLGFSHAEPGLVDEAARAFPDVAFILAHGGVNNVEAACLLAAYRPNVFVDVSGYAASIAPEGATQALRAVFRRRLNHKLLFGTDWPIFLMRGSYAELVAVVTGRDGALDEAAESEAALVLSGNIDRLLSRAA